MSSPAAPEIPRDAWPALWSLVLGFFMILVDSTIVSVAIPSLITAFDTDVNSVLWVTSAYLLAYAVPLLVTGRLGDRLGMKRVYLAGLTVFTLASLWCGLTSTVTGLIAARVVQGFGASLMTPQTMAVITRIFPRERRGPAMALWGSVAGVATLVGPLLGGVLLDWRGWPWIFFVNVPVGVIAFALVMRFVPRLETHSHSFDLIGVGLSAVGLFCFVFGLQEAETFHWGTIWGPVSVPLLLGLGLVLLGVFVWWQSRIRTEPLVPLGLFRDRNFSVSNVAISAVGFTITSMIVPFMLFLQVVRGMTPTQAALVTAPQSIAGAVLAPLAGRLVDRVHPRTLAGIGIAGMAAALAVVSRLMTPSTPLWQIMTALAVAGCFSSFVWGPLSTSANRNLPPQLAGAGAGVYNTTRQMGSVLGSAAIAAVLANRFAAHLTGAAGAGGAGRGGPLPPPVADKFAQALSEAAVLPPAVLMLGWLAVLWYEAPHHLRRPVPVPDGTVGGPPAGR